MVQIVMHLIPISSYISLLFHSHFLIPLGFSSSPSFSLASHFISEEHFTRKLEIIRRWFVAYSSEKCRW